ncbi:MAG: deoxyribodipyrimidine photo-lyase [Paracoccaceae bacterium]|nr:deoxyribodipyrimidine photo-lyase [Paracoccaceae bacterium]
MDEGAILLWLRRDLRLDDHVALSAAAATGRPVVPVFILDPETETLGAAAKWRLGQGVAHFAATLAGIGSGLVLRRGPVEAVLRDLIAETGARAVWWSRSYDPATRPRDVALKAGLRAAGVEARSFPGVLLFEPWDVATQSGGPYRVFTPYWRVVQHRDPGAALPPVTALRAPGVWPDSDRLEDWAMGAAMQRGAAVLARHARVGAQAALDRLDLFLNTQMAGYAAGRDFPAHDHASGLSEPLTYGEISPRRIWQRVQAHAAAGAGGAEAILRQLAWREFAWHLLHHFPQLPQANWRPEWDAFPWAGDSPEVEAWRRGQTGVPFVDAGLREMYVTGRMHNRARMIAASFLTKHLLSDWRLGLAWFADCLTDWDPAANAMGWQWVAGSGPDAAPYFRVFNPETQATKFDPEGTYRRAFIAEGQHTPPATARAFFDAAPRSWNLDPHRPYPRPIVDLAQGRARALAAYAQFREGA